MEEDIKIFAKSTVTPHYALDRLKEAVDKASKNINYENAHNPELIHALDIVKRFIIRRKRISYGGTAINAILPEKYKFYDSEFDLPDYDFFTPDQKSDIEILVSDLQSAGFKDIYTRQGIHEGTYKILVNYTPIADMTLIKENVYDIYKKRAVIKNEMLYLDPDTLRFLMYLELSRPRGEVSRWEKVYERLLLLNKAFPFKSCKKRKTHKRVAETMSSDIRLQIYDFLSSKKRVFLSTEWKKIYTFGKHFQNTNGPLLFISPEPKKDAAVIKKIISHHEDDWDKIKVFRREEIKEALAERLLIYHKNRLIAYIIKESSCNSYLPYKMPNETPIYIGSPETILTFYLSIYIFEKRHTALFPGESLPCLIQSLIHFSETNRNSRKPVVEPFPITCEGYQKGFPTLLKEKLERIRKD